MDSAIDGRKKFISSCNACISILSKMLDKNINKKIIVDTFKYMKLTLDNNIQNMFIFDDILLNEDSWGTSFNIIIDKITRIDNNLSIFARNNMIGYQPNGFVDDIMFVENYILNRYNEMKENRDEWWAYYTLKTQILKIFENLLVCLRKRIKNVEINSLDMTPWSSKEINEMMEKDYLTTNIIYYFNKNNTKYIYNIIELVEKYPFKDAVIKLSNSFDKDTYRKGDESTIFIAGGSALNRFCRTLKIKDNWKSNDNDIFILNIKKMYRNKFNETVDIVHQKEKTIDELLLNFDIPVCRIAYDFHDNIYISIQALYGIITGKYNYPMYMKEDNKLKQLFTEYYQKNVKKDKYKKASDEKIQYYIDRTKKRVQKYTSRGFSPKYIYVEEVIPWIKNRFLYAYFA